MDGQLRRMSNALKDIGKERAKKYEESSSDRLLNITSKKIKTAFIGAIATMEDYFGELWGHGLTEDECTDDQLYWRKVKEECRNEILNKGNGQIRAIENEFKQYSVKWNRYNLTMKEEK